MNPQNPNNHQDPQGEMPEYLPHAGMGEYGISNIVDRIDPALIIDNLDHALKGEFFSKEINRWVMNPGGKPMVNSACRGALISYVTGVLNNNSTLSIINEKQLSYLMESVIESITRMFITRLEEFGFVEPGPGFAEGRYLNRGTPDSARMTMTLNMVLGILYLTYARALNGMESRKLFGSLSMNDAMHYQQQDDRGPVRKMFGL